MRGTCAYENKENKTQKTQQKIIKLRKNIKEAEIDEDRGKAKEMLDWRVNKQYWHSDG